MCDPGAIRWIENAFGDCVITARDKWSFGIGMISNVMWIVSSAPQIYQNCKTKRVDGQSPFLFSLLETGNLLSLVGVILTNALVTQIITSIIYALLDGIMFVQYLYYRFCYESKKKNQANESNSKIDDEPKVDKGGLAMPKEKEPNLEDNYDAGKPLGGAMSAIFIATAQAKTNWSEPYQNDQLVGSLFGWVGSCVYIGSRIPQIVTNFKNKKVIDLSPIYICFTILGNVTYCLSVFIKSTESNYLWKQTPFIVGAIGPLTCDFLIVLQMCIFGIQKGQENEQTSSTTKSSDNSDNYEERRLEEL